MSKCYYCQKSVHHSSFFQALCLYWNWHHVLFHSNVCLFIFSAANAPSFYFCGPTIKMLRSKICSIHCFHSQVETHAASASSSVISSTHATSTEAWTLAFCLVFDCRPDAVVEAPSLNSFKNRLDSVLGNYMFSIDVPPTALDLIKRLVN
jgi:hypothetical protein